MAIRCTAVGSNVIVRYKYAIADAGADICGDTVTALAVIVNRNSFANSTINYQSLPVVAITPDGPVTFCIGGNVTLNATAGFGDYSWSTSATSQAINVSSTGTYIVTVHDGSGCTASDSIHVNVNNHPIASVSGTTSICPSGSRTLTSSVGNSYLWSTGATTQAISVSPSINTSYTVTVTYSGGCNSQASATVNVGSAPAASISGTTSICPSGSTTLTSSVGNSYLWGTGATTQAIAVSPSVNTSYTVTVTYSGGCTSHASATVTVGSAPIANISGTTSVCIGSLTTLTSSVGN